MSEDKKIERNEKMGKLIIDGNSVYEIDEECMRQKEEKERKQQKPEEKDNSIKKGLQ